MRPLSAADFARIVEAGLADDDVLPRVDSVLEESAVREERVPFDFEHPIVQSLTNRKQRDRHFRRSVLAAYSDQCAVTGWKLINGGGRAEAEAAHIKAVEHNGPDSVQNGVALSGTVHWMFDRGLIGFSDELEILIHRKVNDRPGVETIINPTGRLIAPVRASQRPHPAFLGWHRNHHGF
ncbi:MAG: HNH endonuclease [Marinomonas sp.]